METPVLAIAALVGTCGAVMAQVPAPPAGPPAPTATQATLICFGNEPSWSVTFADGMLDMHRADGERALTATAGDE